MASTKGIPNYRSQIYPPKPSFLPPRSPFPSISPSYVPRENPNRHQRTSSESFLLEEQPSWLEDLLNEPEVPLKKGVHRRSSSDSFAYVDMSLAGLKREKGDREGINMVGRMHNRKEDAPCNTAPQGSKKVEEESRERESKSLSDKRDDASSDNSQTEADSKRVKQKFAQRSRVRKLQYIAELERNCQALQAGGCEVSAELEFLDQQNLILNLENTALKQRLENLAQEHYIKHLQQEMLEREIARLKALYHQQQQQKINPSQIPEQPIGTHRRTRSKELETHFARLSLKHRESNPARDPVSGPLRI